MGKTYFYGVRIEHGTLNGFTCVNKIRDDGTGNLSKQFIFRAFFFKLHFQKSGRGLSNRSRYFTFSSLKAFTNTKLWKLVSRSPKLTDCSSPSSVASVLSLVTVDLPSSLLSESNAVFGQIYNEKITHENSVNVG